MCASSLPCICLQSGIRSLSSKRTPAEDDAFARNFTSASDVAFASNEEVLLSQASTLLLMSVQHFYVHCPWYFQSLEISARVGEDYAWLGWLPEPQWYYYHVFIAGYHCIGKSWRHMYIR